MPFISCRAIRLWMNPMRLSGTKLFYIGNVTARLRLCSLPACCVIPQPPHHSGPDGQMPVTNVRRPHWRVIPRTPILPTALRTPQAGWNHKVPSALAHKAGSHVQRNYSGSFRRWQALQDRNDSPGNQILARPCLSGADARFLYYCSI